MPPSPHRAGGSSGSRPRRSAAGLGRRGGHRRRGARPGSGRRPFLGPTLAAELRRLAGAPAAATDEAVAFTPVALRLAVIVGPAWSPPAVAIDARGASSALVLVPDGEGEALADGPGRPGYGGIDLTRPAPASIRGHRRPGSRIRAPVAHRRRPDDVDRPWPGLDRADLVGIMSGAVHLASSTPPAPAPVRAADRLVPGRPAHAGRRLRR